MPNAPTRTEVRRSGSSVVIAISGDVNGAADAELKGAYETAVQLDPTTIVLNFSDVEYINSTGIALIVSLLAEARKSQIEVRACGLSDHYRHIFEVTRLSDFMHMYADETTAVA